MAIFIYGNVEIDHLKKRDKTLGAAIGMIGAIEREINTDLFSALVYTIVGQQISSKAQATICDRMENILGEITPQNILACTEAELQSCGISFRKVSYIRGAAERIADGGLDIDRNSRLFTYHKMVRNKKNTGKALTIFLKSP